MIKAEAISCKAGNASALLSEECILILWINNCGCYPYIYTAGWKTDIPRWRKQRDVINPQFISQCKRNGEWRIFADFRCKLLSIKIVLRIYRE